MTLLNRIIEDLWALEDRDPQKVMRFFKTAPGTYGAHDQFLGVSIPQLRAVLKKNPSLGLKDVDVLLESPYNELRLLGVFILCHLYQMAPIYASESYVSYYQDHFYAINNWNLVDASAPKILGNWLIEKDKTILKDLVQSDNLWHRRIAIVSTWTLIRANNLNTTLELSRSLLQDPEDLIHKATGWMLREVGKKSTETLLAFLTEHQHQMPRTMMRYATERLSPDQQKQFAAC